MTQQQRWHFGQICNTMYTMYKDYDYYFNFALVGPPSVGKSSIIQRYVRNAFQTKTQNTVGYDFRIKELTLNGRTVKLQIYDTAGQERYRSIASSYLKNAHAVFLVYDVHDKNTFEEIKRVWLGIVNDQLKEGGVIVVLANKCDAAGDSVREAEKEFFKQKQLRWYRTSAKTGQNIKQVMKDVVVELMSKEKPPDLQETRIITLQREKRKEGQKSQQKKCC